MLSHPHTQPTFTKARAGAGARRTRMALYHAKQPACLEGVGKCTYVSIAELTASFRCSYIRIHRAPSQRSSRRRRHKAHAYGSVSCQAARLPEGVRAPKRSRSTLRVVTGGPGTACHVLTRPLEAFTLCNVHTAALQASAAPISAHGRALLTHARRRGVECHGAHINTTTVQLRNLRASTRRAAVQTTHGSSAGGA